MSRYGQISLFKEHRGSLYRRTSHHLQKWIKQYYQLTSKGQGWSPGPIPYTPNEEQSVGGGSNNDMTVGREEVRETQSLLEFVRGEGRVSGSIPTTTYTTQLLSNME